MNSRSPTCIHKPSLPTATYILPGARSDLELDLRRQFPLFLRQGEILLLEFFIKNISAVETPLLTQSGKSMVSIVIRFHRELGNMVNTYFQTFLLCLMAYLTLYINLADFGNRYQLYILQTGIV